MIKTNYSVNGCINIGNKSANMKQNNKMKHGQNERTGQQQGHCCNKKKGNLITKEMYF